jgi:hypothetical protein
MKIAPDQSSVLAAPKRASAAAPTQSFAAHLSGAREGPVAFESAGLFRSGAGTTKAAANRPAPANAKGDAPSPDAPEVRATKPEAGASAARRPIHANSAPARDAPMRGDRWQAKAPEPPSTPPTPAPFKARQPERQIAAAKRADVGQARAPTPSAAAQGFTLAVTGKRDVRLTLGADALSDDDMLALAQAAEAAAAALGLRFTAITINGVRMTPFNANQEDAHGPFAR